jgi:cytochrome P450
MESLFLEALFVGLNAWGLQLNSVFGEDPEVFRPERWLVEDEDCLRRMCQVQELIFGYGTTRCLWIPIAMMNLNKIFVEASIPSDAKDGVFMLNFIATVIQTV